MDSFEYLLFTNINNSTQIISWIADPTNVVVECELLNPETYNIQFRSVWYTVQTHMDGRELEWETCIY